MAKRRYHTVNAKCLIRRASVNNIPSVERNNLARTTIVRTTKGSLTNIAAASTYATLPYHTICIKNKTLHFPMSPVVDMYFQVETGGWRTSTTWTQEWRSVVTTEPNEQLGNDCIFANFKVILLASTVVQESMSKIGRQERPSKGC